MRAVRTNRWKYIRRFDERSTPVLPNCDDGESKSVLLEHGWKDRRVAEESLYDLFFDPNEANNLIGDVDSQTNLKDMRDCLEKWMKDTDDPLLSGVIHAPAGAIVNDVNGLSPYEETQTV